jgi:hypothetical protein
MDKTSAIPFGRYYDDFVVGAIYHHSVRKTITESDNNLFSLLTMNPAIKESSDKGQGTTLLDGKLVGPPMLKRAANVLGKAKSISLAQQYHVD